VLLAPSHAPMRLPASRLTAIVQCAMTSRKGMAKDRAGRAVKTTIRLIALFGITACSAANPNTPISRGSRNSAPPDRSAHPAFRSPRPSQKQRATHAWPTTARVHQPRRRHQPQGRDATAPTPKGLKSDCAVGRYLSGAKFREVITGATTLDETQNPAGRTSTSSIKS
jgi:hypothetical protein